jgi:hypothetical protein
MKKLFLGLFLLMAGIAANAQILNPVKLSYTAKKTGVNQYEIRIKALIEPKWHLYSTANPDGGADATIVKFTNADGVNKLKEDGKMQTVFEKAFGVNQKFFENNVDFVQVVKVRPGEKKVRGTIEYMVCNDKKCLPPKEVEFEIKL